MSRTPDFKQFGEELWQVANVLRDDAVHATDRLEIFSMFLFLKLWDEHACLEEEQMQRRLPDDQALIPECYRFHKWADDPDDYARSLGYEDSVGFCKRMFLDLAQ